MKDNEGEFYRQREPVSFNGWRAFWICVVFIGMATSYAPGCTPEPAWGKEQDPYSQLGFVTPNNVTVVPKGPRGIMKQAPAIKRALEADVRRVEA